MRAEHDKQADAIYIYLTDKPYAYGNGLDDTRRIDYSSDGSPRGIELLCVSQGVDLKDLPFRSEIEKLLSKKKIKIYA